MDRNQKVQAVETLNGVFQSSGVVVVAHYTGMSVTEMNSLRVQMAEAGASFKVAKNRLAKRALDGIDIEGAEGLFTGPTAIAYSDDPVSAPKVIAKFAKANEKLVILGGFMGSTLLDDSGVKALAELPSLDELRATLVGMIQRPATNVAGVLQAPAGQLARVFGAYGSSEAA